MTLALIWGGIGVGYWIHLRESDVLGPGLFELFILMILGPIPLILKI